MPNVHSECLSNGLRLVVAEFPMSHRVAVSALVGVGSRFDPPPQAGVSHFVEHLLFRGNRKHEDSSALFAAFEKTGGVLGAQTGVELTEFDQVVHPDQLTEALAELGNFLRTPIFGDFDKEQQIILDEILYDYNESGELVQLDAVMAELLWGNHPLATSVTGTRETVKALDLQAVAEHYLRYYRPDNLVLALAGRVTMPRALESVRAAFADWAPPAPPAASPSPALAGQALPTARGPQVKTVRDADNQYRLQLSFPTTGYRAPEAIPLALLASILDDGPNTRLQRIIREEKALVYHIDCGYTAYADAGQIDIHTAVAPERLERLLGALFDILRDLLERGVQPDELEAARRRYRFDLEFSRDSLGAAIDRYAWPLLYSEVRSEDEEQELVNAVDTTVLTDLARRVFTQERACLGIVGPPHQELEPLLRGHLTSLRPSSADRKASA